MTANWRTNNFNIGMFVGRRCIITLFTGYDYIGEVKSYKNGLVRFFDDIYKADICFNIASITKIVKERDYIGKLNRNKRMVTVKSI